MSLTAAPVLTRRVVALVTAFFLVAAGAFVIPLSRVSAAGTLAITQVAFGQGDAAVVVGPCGERGIIDAGVGSVEEVLAALDASGGRTLEWIVTTHYDADHLGDVVDVASAPGVTVEEFIDRGGDRLAKDTDTYRAYFDYVAAAGRVRTTKDIGGQATLCQGTDLVALTVISAGTDGTAASGLPVTEENDRGLCLKLTYIAFDYATCGDVNGTDEGTRTNVEGAVDNAFGDVEAAKVNHHGSAFSSNSTYVNTLRAQVAIVSVGNNAFGHPDPSVLARWDALGDVYQTLTSEGAPSDGNVTILTSGEGSFTVETSASGKTETYAMDGTTTTTTTTRPSTTTSTRPSDPGFERLSGADRFETAAAVSRRFYEPGVSEAFVASGANFADALAAVPVAAKAGAPILLTRPDGLPSASASELQRLAPAVITIVGGGAAVSGEVEAHLRSFAPNVRRHGGADRFGTAALLSQSNFGARPPNVFIASGMSFADALAGGAAAGGDGVPLLLATATSIPDATQEELQRLQPGAITILGGPSALSPEVEAALRPYTPGAIDRLAGPDRFATSAVVARTVNSTSVTAENEEFAFIANGLGFADALAAGAPAGRESAPVLLAPGNCITREVSAELDRLDAATRYLVGGPAVLAEGVESETRCSTAPGTTTTAPPATTTTTTPPATTSTTQSSNCDSSYPDFCVPPPPPDLDCGSSEIGGRKDFTALDPDPHGFDQDNDGVACES